MQDPFNEIDQQIRFGALAIAREKLESLSGRKWQRPQALQYANLCRRTGLPRLGLKALQPYVRPSAKRPLQALDTEKTEYAACLNWLGLHQEAEALLKSTNPSAIPAGHLIFSFVHIAQWNYREAIQALTQYLQCASLTTYERAVGRVNVLAALVHEREWAQAESMLEELKLSLDRKEQANLYANTLKQELEMRVMQQNWATSAEAASTLRASTSKVDHFSQLFLRKWLALESLYQYPQNPTHWQNALAEVRALALQLRHFETLRECDYHQAIAQKNLALALKVYFGTPFSGYREQLLKDAPWLLGQIPDFLSVRFADPVEVFLQKHGRPLPGTSYEEKFLKPGQLLARLLQILAQDFYAPATTAQLFGKLFVDRHYSVEHSPNLIKQALFRLRTSFEQKTIPCSVQESNGRFYLQSRELFSVPYAKSPTPDNIQMICKYWSLNYFQTKDLAEKMAVNMRTAQREIRKLLAEGKIRYQKRGRSIFYQAVV